MNNTYPSQAGLASTTTSPAGTAGLRPASHTVGSGRIHLPTGLHGFPNCREFVVFPSGTSGLYWLQSMDRAPLYFLLADPFVFFRNFSLELSAADLLSIGADDSTRLAILVVVTLPGNEKDPCTANLQAPLLLDVVSGQGCQLVLPGTHPLRAPLSLKALTGKEDDQTGDTTSQSYGGERCVTIDQQTAVAV